ncbi:LacI family DNA-binding transcriptional regulator [Phycicoccus sonneratiae]|uniref:LacI family DNA-binding transcriptional regulator n=1 Tax=Phycicoccus sonneratiae TaxID=2807628 RepID=A0ABS2CRL9_9MICO|nr:LacI family DNA-binding transcriptional regulator [Phycicoccus sonneraticus]MBM6402480.1 LacI family DNA-binding transcriptional regulator [Phycicoccus sonneraticus]
MSTITDVARVAGVSVATVSRALRGLDRVSPETRQRVLDVAEELHYVASPTATSLASGRTRVVAVVAPFLTRWFFATLVSAIEKELRSRGHHAILFDLEDDTYDQRLPLTQNMLWKRVDGLITLNVPMEPDEVALVDRLGLPLVAIGSSVPGRPCVRIDDRTTMRTAVQHLIDLGHERIGYIGDVPRNVAHVQTPQDRLDAFRATMAAAGLPVVEEWILGSDWTAEAAARDGAGLLRLDPRPTAVVAASDEMAIGVRESARGLGLRVPEDFSVIGIDDYVLSGVLGLTTVRQDVAAQGRAAARLLLAALLEGDEGSDEVVMPTELVVRSSTGPVPA